MQKHVYGNVYLITGIVTIVRFVFTALEYVIHSLTMHTCPQNHTHPTLYPFKHIPVHKAHTRKQ